MRSIPAEKLPRLRNVPPRAAPPVCKFMWPSAPTYPESDEADSRAPLRAVAKIEPVTIFHEPNNIRAESLGRAPRTEVFETQERWQIYAINSLQTVERLTAEFGITDRLHLWPDKSLGTSAWRIERPDRRSTCAGYRRVGDESAAG